MYCITDGSGNTGKKVAILIIDGTCVYSKKFELYDFTLIIFSSQGETFNKANYDLCT